MNLLTLKDWETKDIIATLKSAQKIKKRRFSFSHALKNKSLAMLFQKTSTRTRMSFESAMTQFGGHAQYLDWTTTNFTLGSIKDEAKCMARYVDIIMARVYKHTDIEAMAEASSVPVINGLSNLYHPCQAMADLLTIKERLGKLKGSKLAYIGDGNNVCNSLIMGCAKTGVELSIATPKGYQPPKDILDYAKKNASGNITISNDPKKAVKNVDVVYTDTWISMGQEKEKKKRMAAFKNFTVNSKLMSLTKDAYFMHCLPAHRGLEVSDKVLDSKKSIVFDQAENRLHAQKAIILKCLKII